MRTAIPLPIKALALGLAAGSFVFAVGASRAEQAPQSSAALRHPFQALDADGNSALDRREVIAKLPGLAAGFDIADANGDGRLDRLEYDAAIALGGSPEAKVDLERLYRDGLSAREVIDAPVRGESGERIGDVKDIVVDENGSIARLIVEVGGFFELADQHIGVPWKDVSFGEDMQFVQVPLKEVQNGTYALGGRVPQGEDVPIALTSWRVNELIGDTAALKDSPRGAMVTDVIFNSRGQLQAVLVDRFGRRGLWAYPYTGYYPGAYAHFNETVVALEPFDYAELGRQSRYAGKDASAAAGAQRR